MKRFITLLAVSVMALSCAAQTGNFKKINLGQWLTSKNVTEIPPLPPAGKLTWFTFEDSLRIMNHDSIIFTLGATTVTANMAPFNLYGTRAAIGTDTYPDGTLLSLQTGLFPWCLYAESSSPVNAFGANIFATGSGENWAVGGGSINGTTNGGIRGEGVGGDLSYGGYFSASEAARNWGLWVNAGATKLRDSLFLETVPTKVTPPYFLTWDDATGLVGKSTSSVTETDPIFAADSAKVLHFSDTLPTGKIATKNDIASLSGALPSMSGKSGKLLTNNGSSASWADGLSYYATFPQLTFPGSSTQGLQINNSSNTAGLKLSSDTREVIEFNTNLEVQGSGSAADFITLYNTGDTMAVHVDTRFAGNISHSPAKYSKWLNTNGDVLFQLYGSGTSTARLNSPNNIAFTISGTADSPWAQFTSSYQSLYYSGSKKFETTSTGATITGNLAVTNDPYGTGWNGSTNVPTKDAIYDKIASLTNATPGGLTTQMQYNSAGTFAGTADMTYDGTDFSIDDGTKIKFLSSTSDVLFQLYSTGTNSSNLNSPLDVAFHINGSATTWAEFSTTAQKLFYGGVEKFATNTSGATISGQLTIDADDYDAGWSGKQEAASKDAVYNKIESLGQSTIQTVNVSLDNTTVKGAYESPITLISAPGSGKIIVVDAQLSAVRINYAGSAFTDVALNIYSDGVADPSTSAQCYINKINHTSTSPEKINDNITATEGTLKDNAAIKLKPYADITSGGGSIDIHIAYRIITL